MIENGVLCSCNITKKTRESNKDIKLDSETYSTNINYRICYRFSSIVFNVSWNEKVIKKIEETSGKRERGGHLRSFFSHIPILFLSCGPPSLC